MGRAFIASLFKQDRPTPSGWKISYLARNRACAAFIQGSRVEENVVLGTKSGVLGTSWGKLMKPEPPGRTNACNGRRKPMPGGTEQSEQRTTAPDTSGNGRRRDRSGRKPGDRRPLFGRKSPGPGRIRRIMGETNGSRPSTNPFPAPRHTSLQTLVIFAPL